MKKATKFYINGQWVDPIGDQRTEVINPATEQPIARISLAAAEDVQLAADWATFRPPWKF